MRSAPIVLFSSIDASADAASDPILAYQLFSCSLQLVVSGAASPDGTMKMQFSNDDVLKKEFVKNWSDIPNASVTIDDNGVFSVPKMDICYQWVRVVYTKNTTADGLVSANLNVQGI